MKRIIPFSVIALFSFACGNISSSENADASSLTEYSIEIIDNHPMGKERSVAGTPYLGDSYSEFLESDSAAIYSAVTKIQSQLMTEFAMTKSLTPHFPSIVITSENGRVKSSALNDWDALKATRMSIGDDYDRAFAQNVVAFGTPAMMMNEPQNIDTINVLLKLFE